MLTAIERAGFCHVLLADYSREEIAPARVVRVVIPGVETTNPFFTGWRARCLAIADLLGQGLGP